MSVMTMLETAQGGKLFAHVAGSLDLDAAQTRAAMGALCPAIAARLKARAEQDDDLYQSLLDLIEDGAGSRPLEEPDALVGGEALSDGNAILEDIYGSRNDAMVALRQIAGEVPERELSKLAPIAATAVVAALAQSNRPMALASGAAEAQSGGGTGHRGLIGTIVGAVIAGAVSGIVRQLTSSRRRRGTSGYRRTRTRRKTSAKRNRGGASRRRRTAAGGIDDIFRDILGKLGK
jgi:hypothetical protein